MSPWCFFALNVPSGLRTGCMVDHSEPGGRGPFIGLGHLSKVLTACRGYVHIGGHLVFAPRHSLATQAGDWRLTPAGLLSRRTSSYSALAQGMSVASRSQ